MSARGKVSRGRHMAAGGSREFLPNPVGCGLPTTRNSKNVSAHGEALGAYGHIGTSDGLPLGQTVK
jgi:hypothetical protein